MTPDGRRSAARSGDFRAGRRRRSSRRVGALATRDVGVRARPVRAVGEQRVEDSLVGRPAASRCGLPVRSPRAAAAAEDDVRGRCARRRRARASAGPGCCSARAAARLLGTFAYSSASTIAAMFAETIVLLTSSTPVASGTPDCAGWRTLTAKNMSSFEPVKTFELDVHVVHGPGRRPRADRRTPARRRSRARRSASARSSTARRRGSGSGRCGCRRACPSARRAGRVADHDVVGGSADDVGVAHVVEDARRRSSGPCPAREHAREAVLAARELRVGDRDVAIVGVELQRHAEVLVDAEEAHVAERDVARVAARRRPRAGRPAGSAGRSRRCACERLDRDVGEHRLGPPDEPDRRASA